MDDPEIVVTQDDILRIGTLCDFVPGWADDSREAYICRKIAFEAAEWANDISPYERQKNYRDRIAYIVHRMNARLP